MTSPAAGTTALHDWRIAPREYERHEARRGRRYAYETIDPGRTALVVVDMVRFFVDDSPYVRGIVPNVNEIATALRSAGGTIVWVVPTHGEPSPWQVEFFGERVARTYAATGGAGALAPQLAVAPGDAIVEKTGPSAFFPGRSTVPDLLRTRDVATVVVAGTVTSVCCESTARDASALGYRVVLLADGCADVTDAAHNAALRTVYRTFGDVRATAHVIDLIVRGM